VFRPFSIFNPLRVQFRLCAIPQNSNTPARNASRSDAGGPTLRVAGFEDSLPDVASRSFRRRDEVGTTRIACPTKLVLCEMQNPLASEVGSTKRLVSCADAPLRGIPQLLGTKVKGAGRQGTGFVHKRDMTKEFSVYTEINAFNGRILSDVQCYRFL
jgi:hypothetical protein